jgi:ribose-phosphate pyrophosphokinase
MTLVLVAGLANPTLAAGIAAELGITLAEREATRFPDGEMRVELRTSVRGSDTYLVQPTGPPVEEHLFQLLLLADACRRAGAARITAVSPYLGYARQDRRAMGREPVAARLVADLIAAAGVHRVVAVDLHGSGAEGIFSVPLEHLTAVPLLTPPLATWQPEAPVIVAPDLGATKLADRYGGLLGMPVAFVHKQRLSGERVVVRRVTGEVRGCSPLVIDDMLSTGGTLEAAIRALLDAGCRSDVAVAVTHGLFVGQAVQRLRALPVRRLVTTDSIAVPDDRTAGLPLERVTLARLLADAIRRLHEERSLEDLLVHA